MNLGQPNARFELATSFIQYTDKHVFLTGRAGTGKTTFLRHIKDATRKSCVVVAPTGVAAINAGGVTLHSLFQLPRMPYLPNGLEGGADTDQGGPVPYGTVATKSSLLAGLRLNRTKRALLRELELLIIDEISMVRADTLDAIDAILRHVRQRPDIPFGGVQLLMIGDLFQLPPVVLPHEHALLGRYYAGPFFFCSDAMQAAPAACIELETIYRQQDETFIRLLNRVRDNSVDEDDLEWLNQRHQPDFKAPPDQHYITLTSHNQTADRINRQTLAELPGDLYRFQADIGGEFNENAFPVSAMLELKQGAQIMFMRNDKGDTPRYYNGKIGIVDRISESGVRVAFPGEPESLWLEAEEWSNIRYKLNEERQQVEEEVLGTFRQYPVRLAWAVTIHKSQGLTFERAIIDAGAAFTAGQVYVALSRLTQIEGLVLRTEIPGSSIQCDATVVEFMQYKPDESTLYQDLRSEQALFVENTLMRTFDWSILADAFLNHFFTYRNRKAAYQAQAAKASSALSDLCLQQQRVAAKFSYQLNSILDQGSSAHGYLKTRVAAAVEYFHEQLTVQLLAAIHAHQDEMRSVTGTKAYRKALGVLAARVQQKSIDLQRALVLADGLASGTDSVAILQGMERQQEQQQQAQDVLNAELEASRVPEPAKFAPGESQRISLAAFKAGQSVIDIAAERGLASSTIETHLAQFVESGELPINSVVPADRLAVIWPLVEQAEDKSLTPIKRQLGQDYTFGEVRAVVAHWHWLQSQHVMGEA